MNNLAIGQYIPGNSIIHRLDPRVKIFGMLILIITVFMIPVNMQISSLIWMGSMVSLAFLLILLSRVSITKVLMGMRPVVALLMFTFLMQLFIVRDGELLYQTTMHFSYAALGAIIATIVIYFLIKPFIKFKILLLFLLVFLIFFYQVILPYGSLWQYEFYVYSGGLIRTGFIIARILTVMMFASLLTFTTSTIEINDGLEFLLKPLRLIGLPTTTWAMMLALTFRFIPTLLEETQKIMKAQTSRGVDFKESRLKDKVIQVISLLIPMFVISIKRALELADAMEVRGYVIGAKRTKIDVYRLKIKDYLSLIIVIAILSGLIVFRYAL